MRRPPPQVPPPRGHARLPPPQCCAPLCPPAPPRLQRSAAVGRVLRTVNPSHVRADWHYRESSTAPVPARKCTYDATGVRAMMMDRWLSDAPESSPPKKPRLTEPDADEFVTVTDSDTDGRLPCRDYQTTPHVR